MRYKFNSYTSLILIIKRNIDKTEDNYLMYDKEFERYFPNCNEFLQTRFFSGTPLNGSEIRIRRCNGRDDFNQFANGRYNDPPTEGLKPVFCNQFYSTDDEGLSCKSLFQPREFVYYLR